MDQLVSRLLLYGDLGEEAILSKLAALFQAWKGSSMPRQTLVRGIYHQVKGLLDLATEYGFDENLWQNYLTFLLMTNENSFSLITERVGAQNGSVNHFARNDFRVFRALFHYDFSAVEGDLNLDCFTTLSHYKAIAKHGRRYNQNVSEKVRDLSRRLAAAPDDETFFRLVTEHYRQYGVGMLGLNKAFRIQSGPEGIGFIPIYNTDKVMLRDLVGYESQKAQLRHNTEAFLAGRSANNALLYGDAGTGKSSSVKALINEYYDQGLRMIEIYKHQFRDLSAVIAKVKNRNYRFIIFIDDLSFEENEVEYKFLKAVIEGGVETKPDNILLYATSNRRNLIRETWKDRADMEHENDVHHSDTLEEKLSLSARFGVRINYSIPNRTQFQEMVLTLAQRQGLTVPAEVLLAEAGPFDLLILDVNLPDGSGLSLLEEVKGRVPVILLTANDLETDIVAGLELGAEDYITKPFSLAVLRARVNAQLRRGKGAGNEVVETGEFVFDFGRMEYRKKGKLVELSKTEQRLLRLLVQNRGTTLSRGDLVDRVWTDGAEYVEENALSVTVKRLRDKLEEVPSKPRYLKTVYGIGYTWAVK